MPRGGTRLPLQGQRTGAQNAVLFMVFATNSQGGGHGGSDAVNGYKFIKSDDAGTTNGQRYKKLIEYQKALAAGPQNPGAWPSFDNTGLYPRRFKKDDTVYLGEDCRGVMHFDCISFINFCLITTLGKGWVQSIKKVEAGGHGKKQFTIFKKPFPEKFMNGDILVKVTGEGEAYRFHDGGPEAHRCPGGPRSGVVEQSYVDKQWTSLARLNDSWIS